jgi:hypothetical protein
MSLSLPPERRVALRSFGLVASIGLAAAVARVAGRRVPEPAVSVDFAATFGLVAWLVPQWFARPYRAWERFIVRPFTRAARWAVLKSCYSILFAAAGAAGSRLTPRRPAGATAWTPHSAAGGTRAPEPVPTGGWVRTYCRWAVSSGNAWAVALLPFLALLQVLSIEEWQSVQANIYTLF